MLLNLLRGPEIPIAIPIPIADIGDTIRIENITAIRIVIMIGCVFVKLLTTLPIPTVINLVYGSNNNPKRPGIPPATMGKIIIFKLPARSPMIKIIPTAIAPVIMVLIKSQYL